MDKTDIYNDEAVMRELSQNRSPSRKDLLFKHVITEDKSESLLNAYKVKHHIVKSTPKLPLTYKIESTAPVILLPEGKYNHTAGARISPITMTASQTLLLTQQMALTEKTRMCKASAVHEKLSTLENFPQVYQKRYHEHHGGGDMFHYNGDIADNPKKFVKLLKGTSKDQLTIPGRAADFKDEIAWRMQLRN